jgi:hypothetical protein
MKRGAKTKVLKMDAASGMDRQAQRFESKISKRIGLIFLIIAVLCVVHLLKPTLGLHNPFNERVGEGG